MKSIFLLLLSTTEYVKLPVRAPLPDCGKHAVIAEIVDIGELIDRAIAGKTDRWVEADSSAVKGCSIGWRVHGDRSGFAVVISRQAASGNCK